MPLSKPFITLTFLFISFAASTSMSWHEKLKGMNFYFLDADSPNMKAIEQLQLDLKLVSGKDHNNINDLSELLKKLTHPTILGSYVQKNIHIENEIDEIASNQVDLFKKRCEAIAQSREVVIDFTNIMPQLRRINQQSVIFQLKNQMSNTYVSITKTNRLKTLSDSLATKLRNQLSLECAEDSVKHFATSFASQYDNFVKDLDRLDNLKNVLVHPHIFMIEAIQHMINAVKDSSLEPAKKEFYQQRVHLMIDLMQDIPMKTEVKAYYFSQYSYLLSVLVQDLIRLDKVAFNQPDSQENLRKFYASLIRKVAHVYAVKEIETKTNDLEKVMKILIVYFKNYSKLVHNNEFKQNMVKWYENTLAGKFSLSDHSDNSSRQIHALKVINVALNILDQKKISQEDIMVFIDSFDQLVEVNPAWYQILNDANLMFGLVGLGTFDDQPEMFAAAMDGMFALLATLEPSNVSENNLPKLWDAYLSDSQNLPGNTKKYAMILKIINFRSYPEVVGVLSVGEVSLDQKTIATKILEHSGAFDLYQNMSLLITNAGQQSSLQDATQQSQLVYSYQNGLVTPNSMVDWLANGNKIDYTLIQAKQSKLII